MTVGNDLTSTKLGLSSFLLNDPYTMVKPRANLDSLVDFVLHSIEKYFPRFAVELSREA